MKLQIQGMHCESCAQVIAMELEEIPGFKSARINSATGEGTVVAGSEVSDAQIVGSVAKVGYKSRVAE